jgi:hypothetical protein
VGALTYGPPWPVTGISLLYFTYPSWYSIIKWPSVYVCFHYWWNVLHHFPPTHISSKFCIIYLIINELLKYIKVLTYHEISLLENWLWLVIGLLWMANILQKKSYICNRPWRPLRLWDVEVPTFCLDSRLTDGGKVVSPMRWPTFNPQKIPGTHFCYRLSWPQGHSAAGRIRLIEKIHLIGTRSHDIPACNIVPQPTTLPHTPTY